MSRMPTNINKWGNEIFGYLSTSPPRRGFLLQTKAGSLGVNVRLSVPEVSIGIGVVNYPRFLRFSGGNFYIVLAPNIVGYLSDQRVVVLRPF